MLKKLTIKGVALIDYAEFEFSEGLNVLSGETGAGKSVILDSIDFVLGAKADKNMVRHGSDYALVRAEFEDVSKTVQNTLCELDIDGGTTLILSRKLTAEGKSSLKINGCAVTAAMLKKVSSLLVDVHGQSEHFFLLNERNQLRLLDSIAGERVSGLKSELSKLLEQRKNFQSDLNLLGGDENERIRRADILCYQIDEIECADLKEGEEEELAEKKAIYENAEKIAGGLSSARDCLLSDGGGIDLIGAARRSLGALSRYGERYGTLAERLENVSAEIRDIAETVDEYADGLDIDEAEAERIENRLDEIKTLKKKYGKSVAEIQEFLTGAREELDLLTDSGERREKLEKEIKSLNGHIYERCIQLRKRREAVALEFTKKVTEELKTLNITSAEFEVAFDEFTEEDCERATSNGVGGIRFMFSANAGEPLKELGKIISGGEMSRFMLAVKTQGSAEEIETYLFDEIDAGLSGKTARVVGEKFCKISRKTQIIAVSHLPQIASYADKQFLIEKREEGGMTLSTVRVVTGEERVKEISRLAGGNDGSEISLKLAREMLKNAQIYKNSLRSC